MSSFRWKAKTLAGSALFAAVAAAPIASSMAQPKASPPDFSSNGAGWVGLNGAGPFFEPVPGQLPPIVSDPSHPFVPNGTNAQPSFRTADLSNANLKPWAKERMKKDNDEVLAGKIAFTPSSSCVPAGVPLFMGYGGPNPIVFLQTPKEVWIIFMSDQQIRRIYLDVPHSAHPKPSWYGESVGHYEGDTLVVDTIGMNDKTVVDVYRTPHSDKLHVVERWRMVDDGKAMEAVFTVNDPDTFYQPWSGMRRYRRAQQEHDEIVCAENNSNNIFDYHIPKAEKPDF